MNYLHIYWRRIYNRLDNIPDGYVEHHHIIPRSEGGQDNNDNQDNNNSIIMRTLLYVYHYNTFRPKLQPFSRYLPFGWVRLPSL